MEGTEGTRAGPSSTPQPAVEKQPGGQPGSMETGEKPRSTRGKLPRYLSSFEVEVPKMTRVPTEQEQKIFERITANLETAAKAKALSHHSKVSQHSAKKLELELEKSRQLELEIEASKAKQRLLKLELEQMEEEGGQSQNVSEAEDADADDEGDVVRQPGAYLPTPIPKKKLGERMTSTPKPQPKKVSSIPAAAPKKKQSGSDSLAEALMESIRTQGKQTQQFVARQSGDTKLPVFSGNPLDWPAFEKFYRQTSEDCGFNNFQNWNRLQKSLEGEAKRSVQALMIMPDNAEKVVSALKNRFGRPQYVVQALIDAVRKTPTPKENKLESIMIYSSAVQNLVVTIDTLGEETHMKNPELLRELVEKLPEALRLQWGQFRRKNSNASLKEFATWIEEVAEAASLVTTPRFTDPKSGKPKEKVMATVTVDSTKSTPAKGKKCVRCQKEDHLIHECPAFKNMDLSARLAVVKEKNLCFRCLRRGHAVRECRARITCRVSGCNRRHHTLLHPQEKIEKEQEVESEQPSTSEVKNVNGHVMGPGDKQTVLLRILPVTIYGGDKQVTVNALLDEASTLTMITEEVASLLNLAGPTDPLKFTWTDGSTQEHLNSKRVEFMIGPVGDKSKYKMRNVRTVPALNLPRALPEAEVVTSQFSHLQMQPFKYLPNRKPDILIGQQHINLTLAREVIENGEDAPVLTRTKLGWVLHGPMKASTDDHLISCYHHQADDDILTDLLKESYTLENFGIAKGNLLRSKEDQLSEEKMRVITKRVGNRWQTGLLWKDVDPILPPSYDIAYRRLVGLERKFKRDPKLKEEYEERINSYVQKGYARILSAKEAAVPSKVQWFLPHFPTSHPNKPGKIRIVLDAACRSNGTSLNDKLMTGPDLLVSLYGLLLKFRTKEIAFMGDITEMFHQIRIRPEDCPAQRILWRTDSSKLPNIIQIEVMIFGSACSPFCAQFVKNLNAKEFEEEYPSAAHAIVANHYMDDYLDCCDNVPEAVMLAKEVKEVHRRGGFEINKWASNSPEFLKQMKAEGNSESKNLSEWSGIHTERVLGLHWSPEEDVFTFRVNLARAGIGVATGEKIPTKREILRLVMLLWDPLGFFSHYIIKARILLQHLWRRQLGWDAELPEEYRPSWQKWIKLLPKMTEFKLKRLYSPYYSNNEQVQVHVFADASEVGYCAVAYLRTEVVQRTWDLSFIMSKCRVAPLKPCSIPRLELQAALMASRLGKFIGEVLNIPGKHIFYWTDSMTTLRWIRSEARRFNQFVANRVGEIHENSSVASWNWVPTAENPADHGTREGSINFSPDSSWWKGPDFLKLYDYDWPYEPTVVNNELPEIRKEFVGVIVQIPETTVLPDIIRFSNYNRLVRATAYALKFIDMLKNSKSEKGSPLPLFRSEQLLFKRSQWESYPHEMSLLSLGKSIPPSSPLYALSPVLDHNQVMRMESRIQGAQEEGLRMPILLHPKNRLTKLLIQAFHKRLHHQGEDMVKNEIRQGYYIPRLRTAIRSVLRECVECRLRRIKNVQPRMGDLPEIRLQPQPRPFSIVGMDYFGPMEVTIGRKRDKRYGVLFTCLNTRGVHLEIAHSLTTDSCVMAIRRLIGRRGQPNSIYSDNGTNLRGADKELQQALSNLNQGQIENELEVKGIKWNFIPPGAPHMGGAWERLVRSVKSALKTILKAQAPRDEVLLTCFAEAEAIVNSRPLVDVPVDPDSPEALTPFHFLIGTSSALQPPGLFGPQDLEMGKRWRQSQALANMFWKRWVREYLPTLQRRKKWHGNCPNLKVGDIVVVLDESLRRGSWPLGKVVQTHPGKDGIVRVAEVKTASGLYRRPVTKLGKLDVTEAPET